MKKVGTILVFWGITFFIIATVGNIGYYVAEVAGNGGFYMAAFNKVMYTWLTLASACVGMIVFGAGFMFVGEGQ